jgi:cytochrome b subunit of formate dehydrogenase
VDDTQRESPAKESVMTKGKFVYWLSTVLLCAIYATGAFMYLTQRPMVEQGFAFLGYPAYLITMLIVAKIAALLAILTRVSVWLSDLAYAGMLYHLALALSAHLNARDGGFVPAIIGLVLLVVSFLSQNSGRKLASPNVPRFSESPRRG